MQPFEKIFYDDERDLITYLPRKIILPLNFKIFLSVIYRVLEV